jgi:hypothetical protein
MVSRSGKKRVYTEVGCFVDSIYRRSETYSEGILEAKVCSQAAGRV